MHDLEKANMSRSTLKGTYILWDVYPSNIITMGMDKESVKLMPSEYELLPFGKILDLIITISV